MINVFIEGIPKAQPRPKAVRRGTRIGVYNPRTAEQWKKDIQRRLIKYAELELEGMLEVNLVFLLPRPKSLMRKKDPDGPIPNPKKPDLDNLEKAVFDAISEIRLWKDDSQVCFGKAQKWYTGKNCKTGAYLEIRKIGDEKWQKISTALL